MKIRLLERIQKEAEEGRTYTKITFRDKFGKKEWNLKVWQALQELDLEGALTVDEDGIISVDSVTLALEKAKDILEQAANQVKSEDKDTFDALSNAREILTCVAITRRLK